MRRKPVQSGLRRFFSKNYFVARLLRRRLWYSRRPSAHFSNAGSTIISSETGKPCCANRAIAALASESSAPPGENIAGARDDLMWYLPPRPKVHPAVSICRTHINSQWSLSSSREKQSGINHPIPGQFSTKSKMR
jgi:hypothetical protein